jgi:hypothetical protein
MVKKETKQNEAEDPKKEIHCDEMGCWDEISYYDVGCEDVCCCD